MIGHQTHKYIQTPTVITSDMTIIIPTKLIDRAAHNQGHNLGEKNRSQKQIFQGRMGQISSDN